jgi:nucleoside-diphosphate-sugar epimerase
MGKTILVTGGAGYVGSVLVHALLDKGYKVRVLDRLIFTEDSLKDIKGKIELIKKDIREVGPEIMNGVEAVIHLAGFATEPTSQYNPRLTDLINHIATENLAKMAKANGVKRFIFASSCSVYFTYDTSLVPSFYKETDNVNSISPYSLSKRAAEEALLELSDINFSPIIFRKGTIYGLSPRMRYDLVLNSFIKDAFFRRCLTVNAGGQIYRPLVDVQDIVLTYLKALEMPLEKIGGRIFNVCSENWNIGELAGIVKKVLKEKKNLDVEVDIQPVGIARNYQADNSLFKEVFQFAPSRSLEDAMLEIFSHLKNNPSQNLSDPIFYNDLWYKKIFETNQLNNKST